MRHHRHTESRQRPEDFSPVTERNTKLTTFTVYSIAQTQRWPKNAKNYISAKFYCSYAHVIWNFSTSAQTRFNYVC